MKFVKKITIFSITVILVILIGGLIYIDLTLPNLPHLTNRIIDNALEKNNYRPKGVEGYADNDGTKIWYESINQEDSVNGSVILIMGIANDALAWPDFFINSLTDSGFHVIIFDNRGTGMSDWVEEWNKENAYSLDDMADDVIAIIDTLKIQKVHIIGASLGGMIGQTVSIAYPHRVHSLISIMSTPDINNPDLPSINMGTISKLLMTQIRYGLVSSDKNTIIAQIMSRLILSGYDTNNINMSEVANKTIYNLKFRNGYNPDASKQHITATVKSGSRFDDLKHLYVPVLVIHGKDDPLIDFEHGLKTYELIPNADTLWVEDMGHNISKKHNNSIVEKIVSHIRKNKN